MAHGKQRDAWDQTSLIAALLWNDPMSSRKPKSSLDFNPFASASDRAAVKRPIRRTNDIDALCREFGAL